MGHFADEETPGGYRAGEVSSALQKSLRRGLERESLYWATELDLAGFGAYVWKRLRIVASEDVGPANSMIAVQVRALYENWLESRKGHKQTDDQGNRVFAIGERLFLVHAVILLARAPKSRTVDHALMVMYEGDREPLDMPDWALDVHTRRGKQRGRGLITSSTSELCSRARRSLTPTRPRAGRRGRASARKLGFAADVRSPAARRSCRRRRSRVTWRPERK